MKLMVKFHSAFPARIAHPAVAEFGARAERLDQGLDQQVANENSVRSQSHRRLCRRSPSSGQDAKTNDHVGSIQGVVHSLAVKLRDDAKFVTQAQDPRHNQIHSHVTTVTESLDSKLRDEIKMISQGDAVLRRMRW